MNTESQIEDLTPDQETKLEAYYEECLASGLSTAPADAEKAEAAVRELYACAEEKTPECVWVDSPLAGFMLQAEWGKPATPGHVRGNAAAEVAALKSASPKTSGSDASEATLSEAIRENTEDSTVVYPWYVQWSYMHAAWWRYAAFPQIHIDGFEYDAEDARALKAWNDLSDSCHMVWTFEGVAVLCDRPVTLNLNDNGDLHCEDGPAIEYADGYAVYALQGTTFDEDQADLYFAGRDDLTSAIVLAEKNTEVRRLVATYLYGWERLLDSAGAAVLDEIEGDARLVKLHLDGDDESLVLMDLTNQTCEACGQRSKLCSCADPDRKRAVEGVPNTITTVLEAHAWRWNEPVVTPEMIGSRA